MKSIRKDLFECLDKHGEQTMDDLVTRIDGYTRGQLSNNLQAARKEELIASRRDDVTGGPCYKLTPAGKERLKEIRQKAGIEQMPTDKACCNAAKVVATTAGSEVASLREQLANAEKQRDSHFATSEDYASQLQIAERAVKSWIELAGEFECKGVAEFRIFVHSLSKRVDEFKAELGYARIQIAALNEQLMAGEEAVDVKDAAKGYLVCAPKRKPAKLMKAESAVARAKSAAKATGRCEVFALVPVGIATRKQIQAVEFKERVA